MKWILLTSCLCSLSLLVVGRAIPAKRRAVRHRNQGQSELEDITLSEEQKKLLKHAESSGGKRAVDSGILTKPWPNGRIPYVMDPKIVGTVYETSFKKAIAIWEQYTCVDFVERDDEDVYVRLTNFTSCNSGVGMWDKKSYDVYLAKHCSSPGNAMHELGHVIGFWHEHQRADRDEYIRVIEANLDGSMSASNSFKKLDAIFLKDFGVGYDYASVMHYGQNAFAKPKHDAFKVRKDLPECLIEVGQRKTISRKDIEQANKLYKCPEKPIPSLCELLSPKQTEDTTIRKKNIKKENQISLGLVEDGTWMTCRPGSCFKRSCYAGFDESKRTGFNNLMCTHHKFTVRTTIKRDRSDKIKVGDFITLEGKPGQFLDCTSEGGFCSMTQCAQQDEEGSNGAEECPNHVFRITSEGKRKGDIVQTHDIVHLEYKYNDYYLDCSGSKCVVRPHNGCSVETHSNSQMQMGDDQINCRPPSFIIQK